MKRNIVFLLIAAIMLSFCALAHPGRTDSKGGHKDSSTGEYHYHHGYSAHQHTNGVCPYDFKDKTGSNSGSSEDKGMTLEKWHQIINPKPAPTKQPAKYSAGDIVQTILLIVLIGPWVLFVLYLVGGIMLMGFLNFASWLIWKFAKGSYDYRTFAEEEERRKNIRRRRILVYSIPSMFIAVMSPFAAISYGWSKEVNIIWMFIGGGITCGLCWVIERLLSLLFHVLAEWARKYRGEDY